MQLNHPLTTITHTLDGDASILKQAGLRRERP
jgi:hypothetical protein